MIFRCLNWIETLVGIDMACAVLKVARVSARPWEGCLSRVLHIAGYLNNRPNLELAHDPTETQHANNRRAAKGRN